MAQDSFTFEEANAAPESFTFEDAKDTSFSFEEATSSASVSQMAAATRATIGVVGRAVAARDFAVAGYDAPDRGQLEDGYQPDESSLMPRPEGPKAVAFLPALASNVGKALTKTIPYPRVSSQQVADAMDYLASTAPFLSEEERQDWLQTTRKPENFEKIIGGLQRAAISLPESVSSVFGLATLGTGTLGVTGSRVASGGFTLWMASHVPEQINELKAAIASGDSGRITEASGNLLIATKTIAASGKHALTKPKTPLEQVAPLTAEAVTKVAPDPFPQDIAQASQSKPSPTPLTTEAVAKVVEKEPVPETPTPTPAVATGESGKPPVPAGVPPAKPSVTPEVTIAKPAELLPVKPGFVRMYHGGADPTGELNGDRDITQNFDYAKGYADRNDYPVWYVDVPENAPFMSLDEGASIGKKKYWNMTKAPADVMREAKVAEPTAAKPEGERALTTDRPVANSRLAADVPIQEPYSDKFSVSLQVATTDPVGASDASVIASLPESLRGQVDSVRRFEGEVVPTNTGVSIPGRVQIVFKDKASAQAAMDYFKSPLAKPVAKVQAEVSKVASEEGQRNAKDIKDELIDEIQQKLTKAPSEAVAGDTVTIDIPGDGKFTVPNTVEALSGMLARAKKIKTDAGKIPGVPRASIKSSTNAIAATTSVPKWTPDTLEPESRGPGAAASGEPGTYDPASQLTDALQTINKLDPAERASDSTRIADLWAAGKSTLEKALGKVIAAKESLKSNLLTLPEVTPLKKLVGVIDSQLQSSSARSEALGKAFEAAHPSKVRRGGIAIMVDSGMDLERVRTAISELPTNTPRKIRQAFEAASNLTPKEMDAAQRIKGYFDQRLKDAQEAGVLKNFLEDYYTHVWKSTDKMPAALKGAMNSGQIVSYFENARQRKLESFIEGVKLGLEPVLDPSLVLPRYNYNLDRAIASRAFIKKLTGIKEADGRPTAAPTGSASKIENEAGGTDATLIKPSTKSEETGDYKTVDNPALKGWKWVEKDADGNPIMVQGDLAIHPDALERIRNMMDKARLTATAPVRIAIAVGAEVKGAKLGILSPFHQIHVGSHALWHLVNPFNLKPEIDWTLPSTKFATESGVKLAGDFHDRIDFSEGIGPGLIAQKLVPYARAYSEYLFKSFIPRLKLKTFEAVYQRDLKRYAGKATQDQIAARAADAVNSAYGELNRKWLGEDGRDPRLQRALQVGLLAPDFLEARGRFVGKAFTKFGGEERMALFVMGATLYTTARVLNQLLDGDPHAKELNMMFSVRYNGRNYSVRSVLGDTAHLLSDWRSFVAHRINPFTTRTAIEAISGRELRTGLKRDTQEQVEDLLRQITPAQMDSMLPGDRAWYEGLTQSLGVTSVHQSTPAEIKEREAKAAKDSKNPPAFEFIYNPAHVKKGGAKK